MIFRRTAILWAFAWAALSQAAETGLYDYGTVAVQSSKTSIYIGSVTLTPGLLSRHNGEYRATYKATVSPFHFYDETGTVTIAFSDSDLDRIARREVVEFEGFAMSSDGHRRGVAGKITPEDEVSGKIKVRIFVSKRVELIFNTTYRFGAKVAGDPKAPAAH